MVLLKAAGKKRRLAFHAGDCGVVPNKVIGQIHLFPQVQLSANHTIDRHLLESAMFAQAATLGRRGTCDDDDAIKESLSSGFEKQWNIHDEPTPGCAARGSLGRPLTTDRGMEDLFK